ncbi:MAG: phosphotransferase [Pseudonocardiaceae bacterium]
MSIAPCRVLDHARTAVETVATRLWPGETVRVGPQLPSVTNYVALLRVAELSFVAKYSLLGTSLVSVVRGLWGTWPEVEASQRDYLVDPQAQLAHEHVQLQILAVVARHGAVPLRVPKVIAYAAGVLITVAVRAPSLSAELLRGSQSPDELLSHVADTARHLQRTFGTGHPALRTTLLSSPHSSITDTYARKFHNPRHTREYLSALGKGWAGPDERREVRESLTTLRTVLSPLLRPLAPPVVIYGDLTPDHVFLEAAGYSTWIDPGLHCADPAAELAKLVSRTLLLLVTTPPTQNRASAIITALDQLLTAFLRHHAPAETHTLRRLLALWLADWSNYLTTALSLPPEVLLPLSPTLLAAAARARALLLVATDVAAHLVTNPDHAWYLALRSCHQLARDTN